MAYETEQKLCLKMLSHLREQNSTAKLVEVSKAIR